MLNVAFIGCGLMANWHAEQLLGSGRCRAVAAVDPLPANAEAFAQRHAPGTPTFPTLEALLADPPGPLDAVVIVTPHTLHAKLALTALHAGLHVLVEKPMVTSLADAYAVWRAADAAGKQLAITFQAPYTFNYAYLAAARRAGELGTLHAANAWVSQGWHALSANTWRQAPALSGGGFIYDTGAHLLNGLMWLADEPVVSVSAALQNLAAPVDLTGSVALRFRSGATAAVTFAGDTPSFDTQIHLFTDRYAITTDAYGRRLDMRGRDGEPFHPPVPFEAGRGTPHANFLDALLGREPIACGPRYGALLSALMDAIYASAASGSVVAVEPVPDAL